MRNIPRAQQITRALSALITLILTLVAAPRAARAVEPATEPPRPIIIPTHIFDYDGEFESSNIPDSAPTNLTFTAEIRLRNTGEVGWTPTTVDLDLITDTCDLAAGDAFLSSGVPVNEIGVFRTTIHTPPDATLCGLVFQPRFHFDFLGQELDGYFGEPVAFAISVSEDLTVFDLENNAAGWFGAVIAGSAQTAATPGGVCMFAPPTGDNIALWTSASGAVPLTDLRVYRLRVEASTDQVQPDLIPLWDVAYDNFHPSGFGSIYGGQAWFLDVAGGANGIGRPQGRDTFEVFAAPNAALTNQWRAGAFTPEADPYNDMRIFARVLDIGSGGINANADFGTICISKITVDSMRFEDFGVVQGLWSPPISSATYLAQTAAQAAENAGLATIVENTAAIYQLTPSGPGSRKTLLPHDVSRGGFPAAFYPVAWQTNWVYRGQAFIQSQVGGGLGPEGSDPVDLIALAYDTPTNEIGAVHHTTRGSFNNMRFAASPRLAGTTGGPQPYVAFFSGNNRTLSDLQGAGGLRLMVDLFNVPEIAPEGLGADPLAVIWTSVDRVEPPR